MRRRALLRPDLTAFMSILFMLLGCLLIVLVSNLASAVADTDSTVIRAFLRANADEGSENAAARLTPAGNIDKVQHYIDIHPDRLVFMPGNYVQLVPWSPTESNRFDNLLSEVARHRDTDYIVLLVRPRTAALSRQLRERILASGVDVGYELYEGDRPVEFERAQMPASSPPLTEP